MEGLVGQGGARTTSQKQAPLGYPVQYPSLRPKASILKGLVGHFLHMVAALKPQSLDWPPFLRGETFHLDGRRVADTGQGLLSPWNSGGLAGEGSPSLGTISGSVCLGSLWLKYEWHKSWLGGEEFTGLK